MADAGAGYRLRLWRRECPPSTACGALEAMKLATDRAAAAMTDEMSRFAFGDNVGSELVGEIHDARVLFETCTAQ